MTPDESDVPGELVDRDQWANYADLPEDELPGFLRHRKQPYYGPTRNTSWTTEDGSGPFIEAYGHTTRPIYDNRGVGYVFLEDDEYVAIDLDGCLKGNGDLKEWCPRPPWLTGDVWAEISQSGTGLHTAVKGASLPFWWSNQEFEDKDHAGVECEDGNRFFALTGDLWENHGTTIPDVDEETFHGWLKDVCRAVSGTTPWEREPPQRSSDGSQSDVDLGIFDVISSRQCPPGEKVAHPFHNSSTGENFIVDDDGKPTWHCWRHDVTGNAHHLLGLKAGAFRCGDWDTRRITSREWKQAYDYGRKRGYNGIPPKKPQDDAWMDMTRHWKQREEWREKVSDYWEKEFLRMEDEHRRERQPEPEPADVARADGGSDWETIRELYESSDKGTSSKANYQASQALIETFRPKAVRGSKTIYCYDADVGHYVDDGRSKLKKTMRSNLGPEFNKSRMYEVLNHIESDTYIDREDLTTPEDMVCVQNGVLDLSDPENPELLDHSPEYEFTWRLDTPYDPEATNPEFLEFLEETVNPEDVPKLQEYTGESLRHWKQPDKMGILLGPHNAGKGTYLHVIEDVFGSENVSAETIGRLAGTRWAPNSIYRRPLNIANELSTNRLKNRKMVKTLAGGGDAIQAEEKGDPVYKFVPKANHLFAANEVPNVPNAGEAFYGRWLFVMFPETIPPEEQTPNLDDKLVGSEEKRAGILNWLLEGYARSQSLGAEYTNEKPFVDKKAQWKSFATPLERFKETCIETGSDFSENLIAHRDLYEIYKVMCEDTGQETSVNQGEMVDELETIPCVGTTQPTTGKATDKEATIFNDVMRPRCLRGLRLSDRGEDYYETVKATTGRDTDSVLDDMITEENDNWTETNTFESSWAGSQ